MNNRSIPNRFYSIHGKSKEKLENFIVILSQKRLIIPVGRNQQPRSKLRGITPSEIKESEAQYLLADRGYDSDAIVAQARQQGMQVVIPPKKNRKEQRKYDKCLYMIRHLVENAFLHLKTWRGVATRYAKKTSSYLAIVQIRCLILWTKVL